MNLSYIVPILENSYGFPSLWKLVIVQRYNCMLQSRMFKTVIFQGYSKFFLRPSSPADVIISERKLKKNWNNFNSESA